MPKTPAPTDFQMTMRDDALVTVADDGTFADAGYMPVTGLTISGNPLNLPGGLDGMYFDYSGTGTQAPDGSITYSSLHYTLYGYKGTATFGTGDTVSGSFRPVALATGDLDLNKPHTLHLGLGFDPSTGLMVTSVTGSVDVTVNVNGKNLGDFDISVNHGAGDIEVLGRNAGYIPNKLALGGDPTALHAVFIPA